jgi:hypothetical protein
MQAEFFIIILPWAATVYLPIQPRRTRARFHSGSSRAAVGRFALSLAIAGTGRLLEHCKIEEES